MKFFFACGLVMVVFASASGCSTYPTREVDKANVLLDRTEVELPEAQLVDVRIEIFDPGSLPQSEDLARGLSDEIRKAEAHFIPVHLKATLHQSGHWGGVRVVPVGTLGPEVIVNGKILESDGEKLGVEIQARDARGVRWYKKVYERVVDESGFVRSANDNDEVFQSLYNQIANDLSAFRGTLTPDELKAIRQVAELQFAQSFAPNAFSGHLARGKPPEKEASGGVQNVAGFFSLLNPEGNEGKFFRVARLPAADDPMIQRVRRIRSRDYLLVDTLDQQYESVYRELRDPYTVWREARVGEINTIREVDSKANQEIATGVAVTILGAVAGAMIGASTNSRSYNNVGASVGGSIAGAAAGAGVQRIMAASDIREEATLNLEALTETGESFGASVEPYITEVEGQTVELTGTAAAKYAQWRDVMRRMHARETGSVAGTGTKPN
jgi:outer membrane lipoprotein SlyB